MILQCWLTKIIIINKIDYKNNNNNIYNWEIVLHNINLNFKNYQIDERMDSKALMSVASP